MRLVASSDPGVVERFQAKALLEERVVLATAVVRELQKSGGDDVHGRSLAALNLLRRWVRQLWEPRVETHAKDGLDEMVVPEGCEDLMLELRAATEICEALAMIWTADTRSEFAGDLADIKSLLAGYAW